MNHQDFYVSDENKEVDINFKIIDNKVVVAQIIFSEEKLLKHLKEFEVQNGFIFIHVFNYLIKRLNDFKNELLGEK